ncbi:hypothetical protein [Streptomyces sp. NPDC002851]
MSDDNEYTGDGQGNDAADEGGELGEGEDSDGEAIPVERHRRISK